jgi:acetyl esterase/lipase
MKHICRNSFIVLSSVAFLAQPASAGSRTNLPALNYEQSLPPLSVELRTNAVRLRFAGNMAEKFGIESAPALVGPWTKIATRTATASALMQYDDTNRTAVGQFYRTTHTNSGILITADKLPVTSKAPDFLLSYGTNVNQKAELRVPLSNGPHPVVVLIHGGCWRADFSSLRGFAPTADQLKAAGYATWNIGYRRLGQTGAGWPGTYQDVGHAVDHLRAIASEHRLDLNRVVVMGHSAGGHLAMWVAARSRLPKESPLYMADPLPICGVINLAGVGDIASLIPYERGCCGGVAVVEQMMGGTQAQYPERYSQASAISMLPLGVPQVIVWGQKDDCLPASLGEIYTEAAIKAGDPALFVNFPALGHFEIFSPLWETWPVISSAIDSLLDTAQ